MVDTAAFFIFKPAPAGAWVITSYTHLFLALTRPGRPNISISQASPASRLPDTAFFPYHSRSSPRAIPDRRSGRSLGCSCFSNRTLFQASDCECRYFFLMLSDSLGGWLFASDIAWLSLPLQCHMDPSGLRLRSVIRLLLVRLVRYYLLEEVDTGAKRPDRARAKSQGSLSSCLGFLIRSSSRRRGNGKHQKPA